MSIKRLLVAGLALLVSVGAGVTSAFDSELIAAALDVRNNGVKASARSKALVFQKNRTVNEMALLGTIPDDVYQANQKLFKELNDGFIAKAAESAGLEARLQAAKPGAPETFNAGTDTDVLVDATTDSHISLDDIKQVEDSYQKQVREFLESQGIDPGPGKIDTDTDFMPNPKHTTPEQFTEINRYINKNGGTAYESPGAAEVEAKLRPKAGEDIAALTIEETGEYMAEMQRLARKKLAYADALEAQAARLAADDPLARQLLARAQLARSQSAKYLQRMEKVSNVFAAQNGVAGVETAADSLGGAVEEIGKQGRGTKTAVQAGVVGEFGELGVNKGLKDYAEVLSRAAARNPALAAGAQRQIAEQIKNLSPGLRDELVKKAAEAFRAAGGDSAATERFARELAEQVQVLASGTASARAKELVVSLFRQHLDDADLDKALRALAEGNLEELPVGARRLLSELDAMAKMRIIAVADQSLPEFLREASRNFPGFRLAATPTDDALMSLIELIERDGVGVELAELVGAKSAREINQVRALVTPEVKSAVAARFGANKFLIWEVDQKGYVLLGDLGSTLKIDAGIGIATGFWQTASIMDQNLPPDEEYRQLLNAWGTALPIVGDVASSIIELAEYEATGKTEHLFKSALWLTIAAAGVVPGTQAGALVAGIALMTYEASKGVFAVAEDKALIEAWLDSGYFDRNTGTLKHLWDRRGNPHELSLAGVIENGAVPYMKGLDGVTMRDSLYLWTERNVLDGSDAFQSFLAPLEKVYPEFNFREALREPFNTGRSLFAAHILEHGGNPSRNLEMAIFKRASKAAEKAVVRAAAELVSIVEKEYQARHHTGDALKVMQELEELGRRLGLPLVKNVNDTFSSFSSFVSETFSTPWVRESLPRRHAMLAEKYLAGYLGIEASLKSIRSMFLRHGMEPPRWNLTGFLVIDAARVTDLEATYATRGIGRAADDVQKLHREIAGKADYVFSYTETHVCDRPLFMQLANLAIRLVEAEDRRLLIEQWSGKASAASASRDAALRQAQAATRSLNDDVLIYIPTIQDWSLVWEEAPIPGLSGWKSSMEELDASFEAAYAWANVRWEGSQVYDEALEIQRERIATLQRSYEKTLEEGRDEMSRCLGGAIEGELALSNDTPVEGETITADFLPVGAPVGDDVEMKWGVTGGLELLSPGRQATVLARADGVVVLIMSREGKLVGRASRFVKVTPRPPVPDDFVRLSLRPDDPAPGARLTATAIVKQADEAYNYRWRCENCLVSDRDAPVALVTAPRSGSAAVVVTVLRGTAPVAERTAIFTVGAPSDTASDDGAASADTINQPDVEDLPPPMDVDDTDAAGPDAAGAGSETQATADATSTPAGGANINAPDEVMLTDVFDASVAVESATAGKLIYSWRGPERLDDAEGPNARLQFLAMPGEAAPGQPPAAAPGSVGVLVFRESGSTVGDVEKGVTVKPAWFNAEASGDWEGNSGDQGVHFKRKEITGPVRMAPGCFSPPGEGVTQRAGGEAFAHFDRDSRFENVEAIRASLAKNLGHERDIKAISLSGFEGYIAVRPPKQSGGTCSMGGSRPQQVDVYADGWVMKGRALIKIGYFAIASGAFDGSDDAWVQANARAIAAEADAIVSSITLSTKPGIVRIEPAPRPLEASIAVERTEQLMVGQRVDVSASASGGTPPYRMTWSGVFSEAGEKAVFRAVDAGKQTITVEVVDSEGQRASASTSISVVLPDLGIDGVPASAVFGTRAALKVTGLPPGASGWSALWQASEQGLVFDPPEGMGVTVGFDRMGPIQIWAQVVDESGATVAETRQATVEVVSPAFTLSVEPAEPRVGQEVRARISSSPQIPDGAYAWRWQSPPSAMRMEHDDAAATISFVLGDADTLALEAEALVDFYGDSIGRVAGSIQARLYDLEVSARKFGPPAMTWDPAAGGLKPAGPEQYLTGERFEIAARLLGEPAPARVDWRWSVNDGVSISNPNSKTPTVSRSEAGAIAAQVEATNGDGIVLGRGSINLSVTEPAAAPAGAGSAAATTDDAASPGAGDARADALVDEGRRLEAGGDIAGAVGKYREALEIRPDPALETAVSDLVSRSQSQASSRDQARERLDTLRAEPARLVCGPGLADAVAEAEAIARLDTALGGEARADVARIAGASAISRVINELDFREPLGCLETAAALAPDDPESAVNLERARRHLQEWRRLEALSGELEGAIGADRILEATRLRDLASTLVNDSRHVDAVRSARARIDERYQQAFDRHKAWIADVSGRMQQLLSEHRYDECIAAGDAALGREMWPGEAQSIRERQENCREKRDFEAGQGVETPVSTGVSPVGVWEYTAGGFRDTLTFYPDGRVMGEGGEANPGRWVLEGNVLRMSWQNGWTNRYEIAEEDGPFAGVDTDPNGNSHDLGRLRRLSRTVPDGTGGTDPVGIWEYVDGGYRDEATYYPDGTASGKNYPDVSGTWRMEEQTLVVEWSNGWSSRTPIDSGEGPFVQTTRAPSGDTHERGRVRRLTRSVPGGLDSELPFGIVGGGSRFELVVVPSGISWMDAERRAREMGGHLAVIDSQAENEQAYAAAAADDSAWYIDVAGNGIGPWLGGRLAEDGWQWVSGAPFGFTAWAPGEPNNSRGAESHLQFFGPGTLKSSKWNDIGPTAPVRGFVVERESSAAAPGASAGGGAAAAAESDVHSGSEGKSRYEIVIEPGIGWEDASHRAREMGGHLATVTSAEELRAIYELAGRRPEAWESHYGHRFGPWLGGYQEPGSEEPAGGWKWVTGEAMDYTAWAPSEPNNSRDESTMHLLDFSGVGASWNDWAGSLSSFMVEFDDVAGSPAASVGEGWIDDTWYPVDLSAVGGKTSEIERIKKVPFMDESWIRMKSTDENRRTIDIPLSPPQRAQTLAVILHLDDATFVEHGALVARLTVDTTAGSESFDVEAGVHASEWNVGVGPKHQVVADSEVGGGRAMYFFALSREATITRIHLDYVETGAELWYGHAPGVILSGITLVRFPAGQ